MRRTYRSKKDLGGALDHRDVLLNMDEKSSAFDAFYIQNIKQTKRELSCVGASNAYGVASKKVRKRKYVKRIVKEVETIQHRDTMSTSTYLTPDKSIRVNKVLDPFDELLSTSSNGQANTKTSKHDLFDLLLPKKVRKTYPRKKLTKAKNYSSEYSDSDKENTDQSDMTDIRTHELVVERDLGNRPKYFDESINKIVNNLSLINNFKHKTNSNSFNTSYKLHKNRLSKNCHSPILQKSPMCSTPFKDKYRGKSIYNFSPITTKEKDSPNYVTIAEENNDSNNSLVFLCKEKLPKLSKEHTPSYTPIENIDDETNSQSLIYENDIDPPTDVCETEKQEENEFEQNTNNINGRSLSAEQSLFQITEAEPFLGFSDAKLAESTIDNKVHMLKDMLEHSHTEHLNSKVDTTEVENEKDTSLQNISVEANVNEKICYKISLENPSEQDLDLNESDKSNKGLSVENSLDEDVDPSFVNCSYKDNSVERSFEEASVISKETSLSFTNNTTVSDKESMYDTCESEQSFSDEDNDDMMKEPKVAIERLSDSIFMKYYEKMPGHTDCRKGVSSCDSSQSETNEIPSDLDENKSEVEENVIDIDEVNNITDNDASDSFYNCSQNSVSSTSKNTESDSVELQSNEIIITDSSTTEDIESNDEASNNEDERYVSFVTTRRRNEITKDSMFIFDNSYGSSSTDCDKTVVSNKARLSIFEKSDVDLDLSLNKVKSDAKDFAPIEDKLIQEEDNSHRDIRKSSRLNRQSESSNVDSSINEMTIIGSGIDDDDNDSTKHTENTRSSITIRKSSRLVVDSNQFDRSMIDIDARPTIVLQPGKKWERSLSIYRRMTTMADNFDQSLLEDEAQKKGRKYRQSVISTMEMQDSLHNESINSRRSTFISKPSRSTIRFVKDSNSSRISLNTSEAFEDLKGFLNEECDDTVIELSKLSLADSEFEVTVLDNFHETSERVATARDYVLRRCNQTEPILFDECYPETVLKNCHKIGEGVYGEVFLWRGRDGRARVMKIVPIAGACKVNGEQQKDFHEVISEIVIAMELSALRAPIADIDRYFDEGKDVEALDLHAVENATDVFNEVLAVRCVQGPYPSRLLDLWELYDECKGSENDNPAALPSDQQYMVLELANAGQDLESYQFTGAQQAHALFQQIAFGLAVGEESFQFEHRDLHWGNVLIAPTEQKCATFVLRGRTFRVARGGVAATIIDYSLSRISLALAGERAALYNDLAADEQLFEAVGDYQFQVYRLMRDKLGNEWKNFEPFTNILWLHYTVDKMITALRYKRTNTKIHKHYIEKLKGIKERILNYKSATEYVLTDIEI